MTSPNPNSNQCRQNDCGRIYNNPEDARRCEHEHLTNMYNEAFDSGDAEAAILLHNALEDFESQYPFVL